MVFSNTSARSSVMPMVFLEDPKSKIAGAMGWDGMGLDGMVAMGFEQMGIVI